MFGKENLLVQDLDDVLQRAEESLGITPVSAKLHTDLRPLLGRKHRGSARQGLPPYASAPPVNSRRSFAASPTSSSDSDDDLNKGLSYRTALNEKNMELLELREQHNALLARSQDARINWEAALASKDKALAQLKEALAAERRAAEQSRTTAVAAQEVRIAEARQSAAAAAADSADQGARTEHHMAMMQAQVKDLQASLAQQTATAQQRLAHAEAAQAANTALQNEILLLQGRLSEQNQVLQRSSQGNLSAPGPADCTPSDKHPAENHVSGVVPSAKSGAPAEADKGLERQMMRLQERLVSRDASARKYKCLQRELDARAGQAEKQPAQDSGLLSSSELHSRLQAWEQRISEQSSQHKAVEERLRSATSQFAAAERRAADAEERQSACLQERDEAQRRAEELKQRAEKAEKYALKVHRLLEAMRPHLEAAQKHEAAAQQQVQPKEQNESSLRARLSQAEHAAAVADSRAQVVQERLAITERQSEQIQAALSEERRHCSQARQHAANLEASLKAVREQVGMPESKLAKTVAEEGGPREEAAKELAAARVAWETRCHDELQELQAQIDRTRHAQVAAEARLAQLESCERHANGASRSVAGSEGHSATAPTCRMQKLKEGLDIRERCIAQLQDKLRRQQAHHAQVEAGLRAQLKKRVKALEDADKRFGELESLMRCLSVRSGIL